jgi:hypothetical protein
MKSRIIQLTLLATILVLPVACSKVRSEDKEAIKKAYAEFRLALLKQDFVTATNYLSSDLLALYTNPDKILVVFSPGLTNSELHAELTSNAWVRFQDKDHVFLFPDRPPCTGQGLIRETNGWKITAHVRVISD